LEFKYKFELCDVTLYNKMAKKGQEK